MALISNRTTRVVAVFVCELGCLLIIAAVSSNVWQLSSQDSKDRELRIGLWESCVAIKGSNRESNCTRHLKRDVSLNAVRSLLLLGAACQLPPFALVLYFGPQNQKRMFFLGILNGIAACLQVIGLVIYTSQVQNESLHMGWSYALAWVAASLNIVGTGTAVFAYHLNEVEYRRVEREVGLFEKDPIT